MTWPGYLDPFWMKQFWLGAVKCLDKLKAEILIWKSLVPIKPNAEAEIESKSEIDNMIDLLSSNLEKFSDENS